MTKDTDAKKRAVLVHLLQLIIKDKTLMASVKRENVYYIDWLPEAVARDFANYLNKVSIPCPLKDRHYWKVTRSLFTHEYGHAIELKLSYSFKSDIETIREYIESREKADKAEADTLFALLQEAISVMSKKHSEDEDGIQFFMRF